MEIKVIKTDNETILSIEGRVDTVTATEFDSIAKPYYTEEQSTLVFDCEKMEYISSSGLRVILTAHKSVVSKGGKFILRNLNSEIKSVIDITGFSRILTIE